MLVLQKNKKAESNSPMTACTWQRFSDDNVRDQTKSITESSHVTDSSVRRANRGKEK